MVGLLAEIPDLWDFCLAGWENDSRTSRFGEEGGHEPYLADFKRLTTKPVVGWDATPPRIGWRPSSERDSST